MSPSWKTVPAPPVAASSGFRGPWAASTAYKAGDLAIAPSSAPAKMRGRLVSANTDFTSGASFSASSWTVAEHDEAFAGPWQASTAYTAGQVVSYLGALYTANADFTSAASFNAANWTPLGSAGTGGGVAGRAWAPLTAYKAGDLVTQAGSLYRANADFTSGASFSATDWTAVTGSGGAPVPWTASMSRTAGSTLVSFGPGTYVAASTGTEGAVFDPANWTALSGPLVKASPQPVQSGHRTGIIGDSITLVSAGAGVTAMGSAYIAQGGGGAAGSAPTQGESWFSRVCAESKQQVRFITNQGVSGQTSADILARMDTDIMPLGLDRVILGIGSNDIVTMGTAMNAGNGQIATPPTSEAQARANYLRIVQKFLTAGTDVVVSTITPRQTQTWHAGHNRMNAYIRRVANDYGLALIDFYAAMVDPTNGQPLAGVAPDGTHPANILGNKTMVNEALATLQTLPWWNRQNELNLPKAKAELATGYGNITSGSNQVTGLGTSTGNWQPGMLIIATGGTASAGIPVGARIEYIIGSTMFLSANCTATGTVNPLKGLDPLTLVGDPDNPTRHGLFLTDTDADGVADGFGAKQGAGAANNTASLITQAGVPGKLQELNQTVAGSTQLTWSTVNGQGFVAGDVLAFMCRLQAEAEAGAMVYSINITCVSATGNPGSVKPVDRWVRDLTDGAIYYEFVVPPGTARFDIQPSIASGVGKLRIGQMALRNLTRLGV